MLISFILNGKEVSLETEPERRLIDILRVDLGIWSVKTNCRIGWCGTCVVFIQGNLQPACFVPAFAIRNSNIVTIEGFSTTKEFDDIEAAFQETGANPCSFCAPARVLMLESMMSTHTFPDTEAIDKTISSVFCRCTVPSQLRKAFSAAIRKRDRRLRNRRNILPFVSNRRQIFNFPDRRTGNPRKKVSKSKEVINPGNEPSATFIYTPDTTAELLQSYHKFGKALIYSGGTYILKYMYPSSSKLPNHIIYTGNIEELKRISSTDRYLEVGGNATLSRLLYIGKPHLPKVLYNAINSAGPIQILNMATIGGSLCTGDFRLNLLSALYILDTIVEVRSLRRSQWVPINRFFTKKHTIILEPNEIVTRIRIPNQSWNYAEFIKIGDHFSIDNTEMIFCAVAQKNKDIVSGFRVAIGNFQGWIFRSPEIEAELVGRRLPLSEKEEDSLIEDYHTFIYENYDNVNPATVNKMLNLIRAFLKKM